MDVGMRSVGEVYEMYRICVFFETTDETYSIQSITISQAIYC